MGVQIPFRGVMSVSRRTATAVAFGAQQGKTGKVRQRVQCVVNLGQHVRLDDGGDLFHEKLLQCSWLAPALPRSALRTNVLDAAYGVPGARPLTTSTHFPSLR